MKIQYLQVRAMHSWREGKRPRVRPHGLRQRDKILYEAYSRRKVRNGNRRRVPLVQTGTTGTKFLTVPDDFVPFWRQMISDFIPFLQSTISNFVLFLKILIAKQILIYWIIRKNMYNMNIFVTNKGNSDVEKKSIQRIASMERKSPQ